MPAEWEPHAATWLSWPRRDGISFPGKAAYDKAMPAMAKMVHALADSEPVHINVCDAAHETDVKKILSRIGAKTTHVTFHHIPTNEPWCRDHGPIFLTRKAEPKLLTLDWDYNAWGFKYPPFDDDDYVPTAIAQKLGLPVEYPGLILEALGLLSPARRALTKVVFLGAGTLLDDLQKAAARFDGQVVFAGFVNQREIPGYYLAADLLILPSRRMGETWGLVVNEALHAGCGVIVTDAVGSHREFGAWERVRVIRERDAQGCAQAMEELARFPRSFDWCAKAMEPYSVPAAATAIADRLGDPAQPIA